MVLLKLGVTGRTSSIHEQLSPSRPVHFFVPSLTLSGRVVDTTHD